MHIILATGIFPPAIGGPATYSTKLAEEFLKLGHRVTVVTYGRELTMENGKLKIIFIRKTGGIAARWMLYRKALRRCGENADAVIAFSSVSVGIPLILAGLKKPKKILRLGGDFFWERATDAGSMQSLREWYASRFGFWRIVNTALMEAILTSFDFLVYSTEFQKKIHEASFADLPERTVIENAAPVSASSEARVQHAPFRILFMGRFVGFKNVPALLDAMQELPDVRLTLIGSGPMEGRLRARAGLLGLGSRVEFHSPVSGEEKRRMFQEHDLLILPSVTEISPNVALEAASEGLSVLLTEETGLFATGMIRLRPLRTKDQIVVAIREYVRRYEFSQNESETRTYTDVAQDWLTLFSSL